MTNPTNGLFRVVTDDGILAGTIKPCANHKVSAFGLRGQDLGQFPTLSEAIAAVHASAEWWAA